MTKPFLSDNIYSNLRKETAHMTDKAYKEWLQTEYIKKKKPTIDALRAMTVDGLYDHIKAYKEFMLELINDYEQEIIDGNIQKQIEKQLRQIDVLENFLAEGLTQNLVQLMLDEDIIMHLINKVRKEQNIGAYCEISFE